MSDYTPTTEEVRRGKRTVKDGKFYYTERYVTDIEFDRWITKVKQDAIKEVFSQFSRVTLVDDDRGGIQYERYHVHIEPSIQDNGHTLKLFIKGS